METRSQTLGALAAGHPAATRVFLRHKLDFCCGGGQTLAQACAQAGLDLGAIERELAEAATRRDEDVPLEERSSAEIADHIEGYYHEALRRDVPALIEAARKVERVHASKPDVPAGLADTLAMFWDEMQGHMIKEERILFPLLRRHASNEQVAMPIRVMMMEHDAHAESLERIRLLTHGMEPPPHACATWRALYAGLRQLEEELMLHIHLENNVLFARARPE